MNGDANVLDEYQFYSFPTIVLFPKDKKMAKIYRGIHTLKKLIQFFESGGNGGTDLVEVSHFLQTLSLSPSSGILKTNTNYDGNNNDDDDYDDDDNNILIIITIKK